MPLDPALEIRSAIASAWGEGPDPHYEALARPFRPILARIRASALERELTRTLPTEPLNWLRQSGFTALRLPTAEGGKGASLPQLFNLLIELSWADSNVTQALRSHFGYVEHVLKQAGPTRRAIWAKRLSAGEMVGGAWSEIGDTKQSGFSTTLLRTPDGLRLKGTKFYTTGSLFADWVHVAASDEAGETVGAIVRRDAPGVTVLDDWDGSGQRLTGSGTAHFENVAVSDDEHITTLHPVPYAQAYYQLVHLATLAGIGRAAADDLATTLATRRRGYSHAAAANPPDDPQLLQVVGQVRAAAYAAGAIVLQASRALQRAADEVGQDHEVSATETAELEIWQAQRVVSDLILDSTTRLFDALGASATLRSAGLDRYWRNARTLTSHNPRLYRDRIVGDFAVNGKEPPRQWRVGLPS